MIEIPESLCSLIHGCLHFVYLRQDFDSHFLEELIYLVLVGCIWFFSCRQRSDFLEELFIVGERPVPEHCLEIAGCELGDGKEVLGLKGLLNDAELAFED